jgi:hypothetical protein
MATVVPAVVCSGRAFLGGVATCVVGDVGGGRDGVPEEPIRRTREGASEWEPIKILLEGDRGSDSLPKLAKTTQPLECYRP